MLLLLLLLLPLLGYIQSNLVCTLPNTNKHISSIRKLNACDCECVYVSQRNNFHQDQQKIHKTHPAHGWCWIVAKRSTKITLSLFGSGITGAGRLLTKEDRRIGSFFLVHSKRSPFLSSPEQVARLRVYCVGNGIQFRLRVYERCAALRSGQGTVGTVSPCSCRR